MRRIYCATVQTSVQKTPGGHGVHPVGASHLGGAVDHVNQVGAVHVDKMRVVFTHHLFDSRIRRIVQHGRQLCILIWHEL